MTYISNNINAKCYICNQSPKASNGTVYSQGCSINRRDKNKEQINLNCQSSAISGRALVESLGIQNKGTKYEFNPSTAADDIETFEAVADALKAVIELYIQKGYTKEEARQKATRFADALIANL